MTCPCSRTCCDDPDVMSGDHDCDDECEDICEYSYEVVCKNCGDSCCCDL